MKKLFYPLTPLPYNQESAGSFITRLIQLNSYQHPAAIYKSRAGINSVEEFVSTIRHQEKFKIFLSKINLDPSNVCLALSRESNTQRSNIRWNNVILPDSFFHNDLQHYCPLCLKDKEYWRKDWLFKLNYACSIHNIKLLSHCPKCFKKLNIVRARLSFCVKCQTDIRIAPNIACSSMRVQNWLDQIFDQADTQLVEHFKNFWRKLEKINSINKLGMSIEGMATLAYDFFNHSAKFQNSLSSILLSKIPNLHPRIVLLPFLTRDKFITSYKSLIQDACSSWIFPNNHVDLNPLAWKDCLKILDKNKDEFESLIVLGWLPPIRKTEQIYFSTSDITNCLMQPRQLDFALSQIKTDHLNNKNGSGFYTLQQAASYLNVNTETIRFLIRDQLLPVSKNSKGVTHSILPKPLHDFHDSKILLGALAKELKVNSTNLTEKLASLGIQPVHGPNIDKTRTNIFLRNSIKTLSQEKLNDIKQYATSTGRKKLQCSTQAVDSNYITLNEAAKLLGKSLLQVAQLAAKSILIKKLSSSGNILIELNSLNKLLEKISSPKYLHYKDTLQLLKCSPNWFNAYWVKTEIISVEDLVYWKLILASEVENALKIKSEFLTGTEASHLMGMHKSHISNLSTQGFIQPISLGTKHQIKLYKKSEVIKLIEDGYGSKFHST
ncbi:TniQ family protein [Acinetobacter sp. MD2]|uniref:TniQ family protein n=1 Tax=Acinetobacter sp. MD2 TaxID=2600066 RepID=UPI002D1F8834|nr:TniQ family protein [Acinetobacter sp. MD2]MEB3768176.1 TniQ family protein [Acinetobacter sp. MD2]